MRETRNLALNILRGNLTMKVAYFARDLAQLKTSENIQLSCTLPMNYSFNHRHNSLV